MVASKWTFAWFVLAAVLAGETRAGDVPRAPPHELGFSAARLDYIDRFYAEKVRKGEMAGIVILIARHGKVAHFSAIGYADVDKKQEMKTDSIFRLYSMTKPIASTALMILYEEGRFQMNDPLSKYIPEFGNLRVLRSPDAALDDTVPLASAPTVQDVLRHTAGFSHGFQKNAVDAEYIKANVFDLNGSLAETISKLAKIPLLEQPGRRFIYSVGPDIQARLVEVLSGTSFDEFLEAHLFKPLGMKDTGFWVPPARVDRLASVHWVKDGKLLPMNSAHGHPDGAGPSRGWSSVESYTVDNKQKSGSVGLVSTTEDYWRFAQMILNGGELDGTRILSPQVVQYMVRDHLGPIGMPGPDGKPSGVGFGLGFAVMKDPAAAGYMSSEGTFFWAGAAATHFWIDPKEDMVVVAMSQHMGAPGMETLWAQIRTLVYSALLSKPAASSEGSCVGAT
jgi:CubicO group peptidase (beta-lactamase class C family)